MLTVPFTVHADSPLHLLLAGENIHIAGSDPEAEQALVCVSGHLTDEGVECQALRSESQLLYTLAGDVAQFEIGDEVCVCGTMAELTFCMQGTTIAVTHISRGKEGCPP